MGFNYIQGPIKNVIKVEPLTTDWPWTLSSTDTELSLPLFIAALWRKVCWVWSSHHITGVLWVTISCAQLLTKLKIPLFRQSPYFLDLAPSPDFFVCHLKVTRRQENVTRQLVVSGMLSSMTMCMASEEDYLERN